MPIRLKNAPKFGVDDDATVTNYIDKILTCKWQIKDPQLQTFVNRQIHRYSHTCRKDTNKECWFNYSQPPLRAREILHLLGSGIPPHRMKKHKETWKTIRKQLHDLKEGESITFGELLVKLNISESDYRLAVRSALNSPTVFFLNENQMN